MQCVTGKRHFSGWEFLMTLQMERLEVGRGERISALAWICGFIVAALLVAVHLVELDRYPATRAMDSSKI
jgi:hypothetical protein